MRLQNELFRRCRHNPIITFRSMPYVCQGVYNPGATIFQGETLLLLRVEDLEGKSHLTVARSKDGRVDWQIESEPLLSPEHEAGPYEEFGCEDPRITYLDDLKKWVIAYTAYSPFGPGIALAATEDFKSVERFGLVLSPNNKDAAIFPRKIKDRYWMLHRPSAGEIQHIWLNQSTDLVHWGRPWCVIMERGGPMWDGVKVGASTIPIETQEGWLILYHGVKQFAAGPTYRVGAALLDLEDPRRLISRLDHWVLGPHEHYEMTGAVPNIVFPCGHTLEGDELHLYYGAADTCVCLAHGRISAILEELRRHKV